MTYLIIYFQILNCLLMIHPFSVVHDKNLSAKNLNGDLN